MDNLVKLALVRQAAYDSMIAAAKEARMARKAEQKRPSRLGIIITIIVILLGMILTLALVF